MSGCVACIVLTGMALTGMAALLPKLVRLLRQAIREIAGDTPRGFFVEPMLCDEPREERAIHSARDIVPRWDGKESPRVVVEAHGVVEACRFRGLLAETH